MRLVDGVDFVDFKVLCYMGIYKISSKSLRNESTTL